MLKIITRTEMDLHLMFNDSSTEPSARSLKRALKQTMPSVSGTSMGRLMACSRVGRIECTFEQITAICFLSTNPTPFPNSFISPPANSFSIKSQQVLWGRLEALNKKRANIEHHILTSMKTMEHYTRDITEQLIMVLDSRIEDITRSDDGEEQE